VARLREFWYWTPESPEKILADEKNKIRIAA
jgi:hypothetical protein